MSTARFNTLENAAGTKSVPVATVVDGSAKAWVVFNGTGTVSIFRAFNVSSITDNGVGNYVANFSTAFADSNFAAVAASSLDQEIRVDVPSTGAVRVVTDTALTDAGIVSLVVFR